MKDGRAADRKGGEGLVMKRGRELGRGRVEAGLKKIINFFNKKNRIFNLNQLFLFKQSQYSDENLSNGRVGGERGREGA